MAKPVLISGFQPTGRVHIGNYLGALKNFVELQNSGKYHCNFFIADLHALTENPDPKDLRKNITNLAADFLAAGLDPEKALIFQQSQIKFVEELKWILSPLVPVSELMRMAAFKEKIMQKIELKEGQKVSEEEFDKVVEESNMGLAEYPVLMAADILLCDAKFVPVGHDQLQHLELTRTIARKFNKKFGKTFIEPQPILTKTPRVMSLKNPAKKMSKSQPDGCLFLDDSPNDISAKIKTAVTDSGSEIKYDREKKPAISNLLEIYADLSGEEIPRIEKKFKGKNYGQFKTDLAGLTANHFADFRKKKKELMAKPQELKKVLNAGSKKANKVADKKMLEVKEKVGLA